MGNKRQAEASRNQASFMKAKGIRRTSTPCPVCYKTVSLPYTLTNHRCK